MVSFLFIAALGSPVGKGLTSWLSCVWCFIVICNFPLWCPGSGMVLNCVDSQSLPPYVHSCVPFSQVMSLFPCYTQNVSSPPSPLNYMPFPCSPIPLGVSHPPPHTHTSSTTHPTFESWCRFTLLGTHDGWSILNGFINPSPLLSSFVTWSVPQCSLFFYSKFDIFPMFPWYKQPLFCW